MVPEINQSTDSHPGKNKYFQNNGKYKITAKVAGRYPVENVQTFSYFRFFLGRQTPSHNTAQVDAEDWEAVFTLGQVLYTI